MKKHLFYTILFLFVITALVTLAGITKIIQVEDFYLRGLFIALIIELVGAVVGLYRKTDFFSEPSATEISTQLVQTAPLNQEDCPPVILNRNANTERTALQSRLVMDDSMRLPAVPIPTALRNHLASPRAIRDYINSEEKKTPMLETNKGVIASRFIGLHVDWSLSVEHIEKLDDEFVEVVGQEETIIASISSGKIRMSENPDVRLLTKGSKIRMAGTISEMQLPMKIALSDARVFSEHA